MMNVKSFGFKDFFFFKVFFHDFNILHFRKRSRFFSYISYGLSALNNIENKKKIANEYLTKKQKKKDFLKQIDSTNLIITPKEIIKKMMNSETLSFTEHDFNQTNFFFEKCYVNLDWTLDNYYDIPDIKFENIKKYIYENEQFKNDEELKQKVFFECKKQFFSNTNLLKPLPEVLIIGHTNCGKSSLINNMLTNDHLLHFNSNCSNYAFVSKKSGYTKTLNCFTINNVLRFIDSPGFGKSSNKAQDSFIYDYISNRSVLRRIFFLIDSYEGFKNIDLKFLSNLKDFGVPFEIVFTKYDKLVLKVVKKAMAEFKFCHELKKNDIISLTDKINNKIFSHYNDLINRLNEKYLNFQSSFIITNSFTNSFVKKRYGLNEIRCIVLKSCSIL